MTTRRGESTKTTTASRKRTRKDKKVTDPERYDRRHWDICEKQISVNKERAHKAIDVTPICAHVHKMMIVSRSTSPSDTHTQRNEERENTKRIGNRVTTRSIQCILWGERRLSAQLLRLIRKGKGIRRIMRVRATRTTTYTNIETGCGRRTGETVRLREWGTKRIWE